jgi:hypothetical protein
MPIYIATESTKLKIPDDWDGTKETWPLFKMRVEMACQKVNMTFLTTDATTTELTANASKKFAESLHEKAPQSALVDFLGSDRDFYRTRGIEMFQRLRSIYEPTHPNAISGIIEQLSSIRMKTGETPYSFKLQIELLNVFQRMLHIHLHFLHMQHTKDSIRCSTVVFKRKFETETSM